MANYESNEQKIYKLQDETSHQDLQKANPQEMPMMTTIKAVDSRQEKRAPTMQPKQTVRKKKTMSVKKQELDQGQLKLNSFEIFRNKLNIIVESSAVSIIMTITTIYALFGDDIRQFSANKQTDVVFYVLTIICMIIFFVEILANCIAQPGYYLGYYFYLDLLGTISMILDIGWVTDSLYGSLNIHDDAQQIQQVGRASKTGRRTSAVIRIIRLVRLVKLYKQANQQYERDNKAKLMEKLKEEMNQEKMQTHTNEKIKQSPISPCFDQNNQEDNKLVDFARLEDNQTSIKRGNLPPLKEYSFNQAYPHVANSNFVQKKKFDSASQSLADQQQIKQSKEFNEKQIAEMKLKVNQESKVGKNLQDRTMKHVITIIMSIMISIPLFDFGTYQEQLQSYGTGLDRIYNLRLNQSLFDFAFEEYINFHKGKRSPVIFVYINQGFQCCDYTSINAMRYFDQSYPAIEDLRMSEIGVFTTTDDDKNLLGWCAIDQKEDNDLSAGLSIIRTVFVCAVMAISAIVLAKDIQMLVLQPIESMLMKVERISKNPLEAAQIEEQEELLSEQLQMDLNKDQLKLREESQKMETVILEKLIMKIGALLAVGFGEAGSEIIASNMSRGGDVDPMLPGKKMMAIFGFCDIRNFTDATEVLQQGVMMFVNEIAEIVHGTVDHYNGSSNKNIGDAFLLVWKFEDIDYAPDPDNPRLLKLHNNNHVKQQGDYAVMAFLKIITAITVSKKLSKYKSHPGLNERLKNYSVKMGFGLHMGWAIEGAIGSTFKIDASYLSPNVNMSSRLEAATKQFGCSILISGILKQILTDKCKEHLRHIDTVTVKGSIAPVELHTIDISFKSLIKAVPEYDQYDSNVLTKQQKKKARVSNRYSRDELKQKVMSQNMNIADEFNTDPELISIREPFTKNFYREWSRGFQFYIDGRWNDAKNIMLSTLNMIPDHVDGPSNTLLSVIQEFGGQAPSSWKGFRELTEK